MFKKKKIIIAGFIILILVSFIFVNFIKKDKTQNNEVVWNEATMNFSRVSFFNTEKYRASLAVPDYWEGNYRMKDEGREVVFLNIDDPQNPQELFRIKSLELVDPDLLVADGWQELYSRDGTQFVYKLSTVEDERKNKENNFSKMLQETVFILKSFKVN